MPPLSKEERISMAMDTRNASEAVLNAEGEEGDFDDAERYYRDDASDEELREEHKKWTELAKKRGLSY